MSKPYTYPVLYDEVLQLHISKLKDWGYLKPKQTKRGVITWSRNGSPTGNISIKSDTYQKDFFIELSYNYKNKEINYKIHLVSMPSNLGKGLIWYFLCPQTKKRCRKLYLINGYFLHREAFNGCLYETQTLSKKYRKLDKTFGVYFRTDDLYSQLYKKHFKKTYAGKPTKKYLLIMEQIQKAESIPYHEIERAMLS
ncbi:conserved hypothetical protein [Tenacibaculum litopenaei]|uniref:hypothetical protein n=1 Tax=Tenacibaculum litopenaei TaxID=396016 RepID=UPI0038963348